VPSLAPRARVVQTGMSVESQQVTPSGKAKKEIENITQKTTFIL
jgi:hypothetical protein